MCQNEILSLKSSLTSLIDDIFSGCELSLNAAMASVKSRQVSCNGRYLTSAADVMMQCHLQPLLVTVSHLRLLTRISSVVMVVVRVLVGLGVGVWVAVVLVGAEVGEVGVGEVGLDMEEMEVKESGTHLMGFDLVVVVEVSHVGMVLVVEVVEADLLMVRCNRVVVTCRNKIKSLQLEVHLNWPRRRYLVPGEFGAL